MPMNSASSNEVPSFCSIDIDVLGQPDDATCGPTSLHSVYRYYGDDVPLDQVIQEVHKFEDGGTLAVWLGAHALARGYEALVYSCNLQLLDPSWFATSGVDLVQKLQEQLKWKNDDKLIRTSQAFIDFIQRGGKLRLEDVTRDVLRRWLSQGYPILTGLSSTFLYRSPREIPPNQVPDDVNGVPAGHFVILCGYDRRNKTVTVADPLTQNPYSPSRKYNVHIDRVICSILLGVLTYDANFLIIKPRRA
jgi:hypothetical protein